MPSLFPRKVAPPDDAPPFAHSAVRHQAIEGVNLAILSQALPQVPQAEMQAELDLHPTRPLRAHLRPCCGSTSPGIRSRPPLR